MGRRRQKEGGGLLRRRGAGPRLSRSGGREGQRTGRFRQLRSEQLAEGEADLANAHHDRLLGGWGRRDGGLGGRKRRRRARTPSAEAKACPSPGQVRGGHKGSDAGVESVRAPRPDDPPGSGGSVCREGRRRERGVVNGDGRGHRRGRVLSPEVQARDRGQRPSGGAVADR